MSCWYYLHEAAATAVRPQDPASMQCVERNQLAQPLALESSACALTAAWHSAGSGKAELWWGAATEALFVFTYTCTI
jgi:hypothetical protein